MDDKKSNTLLNYLKNIFCDSCPDHFNIDHPDEPYQELKSGLKYLKSSVDAFTDYLAEFSKGNLSAEYPEGCDFLGGSLKELHKSLKHLTWQARQVADGDYSQHASNLGDISDAFNGMTRQLEQRESQLKENANKVQKRAEALESYNELLIELLSRRNEWLLVVDMNSKEILYCNKKKHEGVLEPSVCKTCKNRLSFQPELLKWEGQEQYKVWEMSDDTDTYYRITSFPIELKEHNSCVHIVVDVTDEKRAAKNLTSKAYHDPGTGIKNRLFFEEYMSMLLKDKRDATLCYLDLDGLKYVNDTYGHLEGDMYIQNFVELIKQNFRSEDTFARTGGDEFCLVLSGSIKELIERKLAEILHEFQTKDFAEYQCSFSYGVVAIDGEENKRTLDEILHDADALMYACKRRNKEKYPELVRG